MDVKEYQQVVTDPGARRERYREMLPAFYRFATGPYRENWADSFHLPPFGQGETLNDALRRQEQALAAAARFGPGMRLLDVGCGVGGPATSIASFTGAHVTGVNIVPLQVELAREKAALGGTADQVDFVLGDMMDLPFEEGFFDGVYSFDAICHSPDKAGVYREVARVLKPGGVFTGCDWLCTDGLTAREYAEWIEPICASSALPSILPLGEVSRLLTAAGFEVLECADLALRGDMEPNWDLLQLAADGIERGRSPEMEQLWHHSESTARGGRSGRFIIGTWLARKPVTARGSD